MSKEEFISLLKNLKISVTEEQIKQLEIYKEFLKEYNEHTNLTRITSDEDIYLKHFYDSLTICKVLDLNKINNLLDIGSGAGFPGMVIKIFFPKINITLIDSNNKKTKFLEELKEKLNIEVTIINNRVENYAKDNLNKFDIVTARAVANLRVLTEIALPLVKVKGLFVAFKGDIKEELKDATSTINLLNSSIIKRKEFSLSENENIRNIIVIQKYKETKKESLRPYNKILKKPLKKFSK